jgi:hypothetical protein
VESEASKQESLFLPDVRVCREEVCFSVGSQARKQESLFLPDVRVERRSVFL